MACGKGKSGAVKRAEMRMVRWMCGVKLQDRVPNNGLRLRLGLDDIISFAMVWHVLRVEDNDWVNNCVEYEVEGCRPRGRPKRTWRNSTGVTSNGGAIFR